MTGDFKPIIAASGQHRPSSAGLASSGAAPGPVPSLTPVPASAAFAHGSDAAAAGKRLPRTAGGKLGAKPGAKPGAAPGGRQEPGAQGKRGLPKLSRRERLLLCLLIVVAALSALVLLVLIPGIEEEGKAQALLDAALDKQAQANAKIAAASANDLAITNSVNSYNTRVAAYAEPMRPEDIDRFITGLCTNASLTPVTLTMDSAVRTLVPKYRVLPVNDDAVSAMAMIKESDLDAANGATGDASGQQNSQAAKAIAQAATEYHGSINQEDATGASLVYSYRTTVTCKGGIESLYKLMQDSRQYPWLVIESFAYSDDSAKLSTSSSTALAGAGASQQKDEAQDSFTLVFRIYSVMDKTPLPAR
jgi:hypothetical protein